MTLKDWLQLHNKNIRDIPKINGDYKVRAYTESAEYKQLFRLTDYSAIMGSERGVVWLIAKEKT